MKLVVVVWAYHIADSQMEVQPLNLLESLPQDPSPLTALLSTPSHDVVASHGDQAMSSAYMWLPNSIMSLPVQSLEPLQKHGTPPPLAQESGVRNKETKKEGRKKKSKKKKWNCNIYTSLSFL
jgi:hypothetical protein